MLQTPTTQPFLYLQSYEVQDGGHAAFSSTLAVGGQQLQRLSLTELDPVNVSSDELVLLATSHSMQLSQVHSSSPHSLSAFCSDLNTTCLLP